MTKKYILLLTVLTSLNLFAQDYTIDPNDSVSKAIIVSAYESGQIDLPHDNSTADSLELNWEMISNTTPAGWDFSVCDYTNCYTGVITSGTMTKFGQNQSGFIKINLVATDGGSSVSQFKIWKTSAPNDFDTLTFIFNATLGINDIELGEKVVLFPNPSNGSELTVENILSNSTISFTNALGQVILSEKNISNTFTLNNIQLNKGVYFMKLERDGKQYSNRKVIIQ